LCRSATRSPTHTHFISQPTIQPHTPPTHPPSHSFHTHFHKHTAHPPVFGGKRGAGPRFKVTDLRIWRRRRSTRTDGDERPAHKHVRLSSFLFPPPRVLVAAKPPPSAQNRIRRLPSSKVDLNVDGNGDVAAGRCGSLRRKNRFRAERQAPRGGRRHAARRRQKPSTQPGSAHLGPPPPVSRFGHRWGSNGNWETTSLRYRHAGAGGGRCFCCSSRARPSSGVRGRRQEARKALRPCVGGWRRCSRRGLRRHSALPLGRVLLTRIAACLHFRDKKINSSSLRQKKKQKKTKDQSEHYEKKQKAPSSAPLFSGVPAGKRKSETEKPKIYNP